MSSNYPRPLALWSGWTTARVADGTAAAAFDADELLRTSIGSSLRRMMGTGAGTLVAFALSIFVPFVAGAALSTPQFAFWALLNTISSVALTLDFGAATMLPALLARDPSSHRAIIASGSALTALGSVVVGSLGMLAWWGMQPRLGVQGWGMRSGELALLGTTIGSVLRSVVQVVAAVALVGRKDVFRNALLVTQAACQAVLTCALLFVTHSAWALPLGLCISGALTAIVGVSCLERLRAALMQMTHAGDGRGEPIVIRREIRRYAIARSGTVLLSGVLTQADRWVVGAIAGPASLATYELAWRYAVIPKFVVLAGTQYLVPDVARLRLTPSAVARTVRQSVRIVGVLLALLVPALTLLAVTTFPLLKHGSLHVFIPILAFLLAGHTAHALTAPGTMAVNGLGEPQREIPYLVVAVLVASAGWIAVEHLHAALPLAMCTSLAFVAGSLFFGVTRPWLPRAT